VAAPEKHAKLRKTKSNATQRDLDGDTQFKAFQIRQYG